MSLENVFKPPMLDKIYFTDPAVTLSQINKNDNKNCHYYLQNPMRHVF